MSKETFTEEEMKKAFDECDGCMSCGWHGAFWEVQENLPFEPTNHPTRVNEYWAPCSKDNGEDISDHRGYYIYPKK